jgi:16S rRNA (guanine(966)-N(2))-methyltransferase RsmD
MRVIAGRAKGTHLGQVPHGTRPLSDRAREGLFSSLGDLSGLSVLDLYAGTGAIGIEALSRGATSCLFVDKNPDATRAIRKNLQLTGLGDGAAVRRRAVLAFLRSGPASGFDLITLDPPYATEQPELDEAFSLLSAGWLAAGGAWRVILTRPTKGYTPVIPIDWIVAKRLDYGDTYLVILGEAP